MTTTTTPGKARSPLPGARLLRDGRSLYWWVEIGAVLVFYFVYSAIRNLNAGDREIQAFHNARRLIDWQHAVGLNHEETLQEWALHFKPLIVLCNYFYGSLHFAVTIFAAVWLFRRFSDDYARFRNTLGVTTALALIGFRFFPLMPPRLLPTTYGFVDTLAKYPTFWSFHSGAMSKISNQFAAMPSVHIAWATWCALVLVPRLRTGWARTLAVLYPALTVVVIVLTANHYFLDAVGGVLILAVGYPIAHGFTRAGRGRPEPATAGADATPGPAATRLRIPRWSVTVDEADE